MERVSVSTCMSFLPSSSLSLITTILLLICSSHQPPKGHPSHPHCLLPALQTLQQVWKSLQSSPDPAHHVAWCKDVFTLIDCTLTSAGQAPHGPLNLSNAVLQCCQELLLPYWHGTPPGPAWHLPTEPTECDCPPPACHGAHNR